MISPFFNLVLGSYKIVQQNPVHKYQNHKTLEKSNPFNHKYDESLKHSMKFDLKEQCDHYEEDSSIQICRLQKKQNFSLFYNTFLSIGEEIKNAEIHFPFFHKETKETTVIPLSDYFSFEKIKDFPVYDNCGYFIINIPIKFQWRMPQNGETLKYWHSRFNYDPNPTNEISDSRFEFYISDKPGFNGLAFIQIIFNKTPRSSMNTFVDYNDGIANLFGYSYVKNKSHKEMKNEGIFHENDIDEYSFPILNKKQRTKLKLDDLTFKARIVKMKDLSTSYKKEDICYG